MRLSKQLNSICEKALDVKFNEYSDIIEYIKNMTGSGFILDKLSKDTYELSTYRMSGIYQNASVLCKEKDLEPLKKMTDVEEQQRYLLDLVKRGNDKNKKKSSNIKENLDDTLDKAIRKEIVSWKADFLDAISGEIDETLNTIAENNDYRLYDDALVIDVKGRPNILLDLKELGVAENAVENAIYSFINRLSAEWNDFTVLGRSGGYWGFENATEQVGITDKGIDKIVAKVKEVIEDEFAEELDEADGNEVEIAGVVYTALSSFTSDIAEVLLDDTALTFDADLMNKMAQLEEKINQEESAMNKKEYWVQQ